MIAVRGFAPDQETLDHGRRVLPSRRMTPGATGGLDGPGNLGPEHAGALTLVYGAFADDASAQRGFRKFTDAQRILLDTPGFIRWFSFADGPHGYGLGLWRSASDAATFARGPFHRDVVSEQRHEPFEYSQFAGIYAAHTIGRRTFTCPRCGTTCVAPCAACTRCGEGLGDGFDR